MVLRLVCKQKPCPCLCRSKDRQSTSPVNWRKATGWCQGHHNVLPIHWVYLGKDVSANESPSSSLNRRCGLSGIIDTSGARTENRFQSLHLTKDMLDINLAGWHQHKMWDLFCGKSTINPNWQKWKVKFVFIAASTISAPCVKVFLQKCLLALLGRHLQTGVQSVTLS